MLLFYMGIVSDNLTGGCTDQFVYDCSVWENSGYLENLLVILNSNKKAVIDSVR